MSRLYIRVETSFYTHRKTAKLRSLIGDDAFWIVPKLWAYAAENQPDGDLSRYESPQLAMLLGCPKHATSILEALIECGFVDSDGIIHDWGEYNGYHLRFSERAKAAAQARWAKKKEPKKRQGTVDSGQGTVETSNASSMLVAFETFWRAYPRKVGRGLAEEAFAKVGGVGLLDRIIPAIEAQRKAPDWTKDGGQFIPHPTTWLNQKRWEDDLVPSIKRPNRSPNI
jgi:hypothetical protein